MRPAAVRRRMRGDERGQAVVEFLVILPVFLILAFGLIEFGKGLGYWINLSHIANEGARYAAVNKWPGCPDDDTSGCPSLVDYLKDRAIAEDLISTGGNATPMEVDICFPEGSELGDPVRVAVTTTYTLALVNRLFGADNQVGSFDLTASATMRLERTPTANRLLAEAGSC